MCNIVLDGVLIWKGTDILPHILILHMQIEYCAQFPILFENAEHGHGLLYSSGDPPTRAGIPADFLSQLFLQCIRELRQIVVK